MAARADAGSIRWPTHVRRRDGHIVAFDVARIEQAVGRAAQEVGCTDRGLPTMVAEAVAGELASRFRGRAPGVEEIQDAVHGLGVDAVRLPVWRGIAFGVVAEDSEIDLHDDSLA